jgi:prephenate dehydratase
MILGALGGPDTFGGQAARILLSKYPEFTDVVYLANSDEAFGVGGSWHSDASCVPEQTSKTGFHVSTQRKLVAAEGKLFVLGEISHVYHCCLWVRPGTDPSRIRRVLGHTGSINQSRDWICAHFPRAAIEIVDTHSVGAAMTVAEGDGTLAAVCTAEIGHSLGLHQVAADIDGGSTGHYWAISALRNFAPHPTRLVVAGHAARGGSVSEILCGLRSAGFGVRTIWTEHAGTGMFAQDVVAALVGSGRLADVQAVLDKYPADFWLAGAFVSREPADVAATE